MVNPTAFAVVATRLHANWINNEGDNFHALIITKALHFLYTKMCSLIYVEIIYVLSKKAKKMKSSVEEWKYEIYSICIVIII